MIRNSNTKSRTSAAGILMITANFTFSVPNLFLPSTTQIPSSLFVNASLMQSFPLEIVWGLGKLEINPETT
jgi:hypothetical protein